ncbi:MAG: hypothetical protein ABWY00_19255 [Dongiaceae bacterium]
MSRRAINLTIIVLGILLLNGLAFAGAGRTESLLDGNQMSPRLESNTANHRTAEDMQIQACLADQIAEVQAAEPKQDTPLAQQAAPGESVVASAATTPTDSDCDQN